MSSFVILVAQGYTQNFKPAPQLFEEIVAAGTPPPFEVEMVVANGPRIAGTVLIFYLESDWGGAPAEPGRFDFNGGFVDAWLGPIAGVGSPDYIVEFYGPRESSLEGYWPGINVVRSQRLGGSAADAAPD